IRATKSGVPAPEVEAKTKAWFSVSYARPVSSLPLARSSAWVASRITAHTMGHEPSLMCSYTAAVLFVVAVVAAAGFVVVGLRISRCGLNGVPLCSGTTTEGRPGKEVPTWDQALPFQVVTSRPSENTYAVWSG